MTRETTFTKSSNIVQSVMQQEKFTEDRAASYSHGVARAACVSRLKFEFLCSPGAPPISFFSGAWRHLVSVL